MNIIETKLNWGHVPKLFFRYVDDVFAIFDTPNDSEKFLGTCEMNSLHPNLKFTLRDSRCP